MRPPQLRLLKGTQRHDLQIKLDEHKVSAPDTKLILSMTA